MATVDPADDDRRRYVVRHYAYDPERHERCHQLVGAYSRKSEAVKVMQGASDELKGRRARGERVDQIEHYSMVELEPGHARRAQQGRLLRDAIRRGAHIDAERLDLPRNVDVLRATREGPAK